MMKKKVLLTSLIVLAAGTVYASEMVVHLKSDNALVIEYTGSIESVTLQGASDSIIGMKMNVAEPHGQQQGIEKKTTGRGEDSTTPPARSSVATVVRGENTSSSVRIKWAKPIDDENLKNARSPSREASWFK